MKTNLILFALLVSFFSSQAWSQSITNVKGQKVLLDLGGEAWGPGDKVFGLDGQGRRKALVQIRQVRGGKATADVLKGAPQAGMTLMKAGGSSGARSAGGGAAARGVRVKQAFGYTGSLLMNTMKIKNWQQNGTNYSFDMTGMGFGGGIMYDYPLSSSWFARGNATLESFDVKKKVPTAICKNSTECSVQFLQSGWYGTFNYVFSASPYRFWAGGGGGAVIYLSKKSTVLSTGKFFFNTILMGAAGLDIFTSRNTFIPIALEYQMIPDKQAAVNTMAVRVGWAKTF